MQNVLVFLNISVGQVILSFSKGQNHCLMEREKSTYSSGPFLWKQKRSHCHIGPLFNTCDRGRTSADIFIHNAITNYLALFWQEVNAETTISFPDEPTKYNEDITLHIHINIKIHVVMHNTQQAVKRSPSSCLKCPRGTNSFHFKVYFRSFLIRCITT